MASPKKHVKATAVLIVALYAVGFVAGFALDYKDIAWLIIFGVLIDVDHIPFGRLWKAFRRGGVVEIIRIWKKYGWFDADHLNLCHTWPFGISVTLISIFWGGWVMFVAFSIHCLIDSFSLSGQHYPKCSPLSRDIGRLIIWLGLKRFMYKTEGIPSLIIGGKKNG